MKLETKDEFNHKLKDILSTFKDLACEEFGKHIKMAIK